MKVEDRYLKFVRWEEEDRLYVGYCPDLFPWGGVCHAAAEDEAFRQLSALVKASGRLALRGQESCGALRQLAIGAARRNRIGDLASDLA